MLNRFILVTLIAGLISPLAHANPRVERVLIEPEMRTLTTSTGVPVEVEVLRSGYTLPDQVVKARYNSQCQKRFPPDGHFAGMPDPAVRPMHLYVPVAQDETIASGFDASIMLDRTEAGKPYHPYDQHSLTRHLKQNLLETTVTGATWIQNLVVQDEIYCEHEVIPEQVPALEPVRAKLKATPSFCGGTPSNTLALESGATQKWFIAKHRLAKVIDDYVGPPGTHSTTEVLPREWEQPFAGTRYINRTGHAIYGDIVKLNHCFCAKHAGHAQLDLGIKVDDVASLSFNGTEIAHQTKKTIQAPLHLVRGKNCMTIDVQDTGEYWQGIDFLGTLKTDAAELVDLDQI